MAQSLTHGEMSLPADWRDLFALTKPRVMSVSYTHLDVYKRQLLGGAIAARRLQRRAQERGDDG